MCVYTYLYVYIYTQIYLCMHTCIHLSAVLGLVEERTCLLGMVPMFCPVGHS